MSSMTPALTIFVNIGMVLVAWNGGLQAIRGDLSVGQIIAFTNDLLVTMSSLIFMTQLANVWANGIASARRANDVLETAPEIPPAVAAKRLSPTLTGSVVFEAVSFHYHSQNGNGAGETIRDANPVLVINDGQIVEKGTHQQLLDAHGFYHHLYMSQFKGQAI